MLVASDYSVFFIFQSNHYTLNTKVDLLKNKFGFDEAFNYKEEPDLNAALKRSVSSLSVTVK